jgi:hypothetical protein
MCSNAAVVPFLRSSSVLSQFMWMAYDKFRWSRLASGFIIIDLDFAAYASSNIFEPYPRIRWFLSARFEMLGCANGSDPVHFFFVSLPFLLTYVGHFAISPASIAPACGQRSRACIVESLSDTNRATYAQYVIVPQFINAALDPFCLHAFRRTSIQARERLNHYYVCTLSTKLNLLNLHETLRKQQEKPHHGAT